MPSNLTLDPTHSAYLLPPLRRSDAAAALRLAAEREAARESAVRRAIEAERRCGVLLERSVQCLKQRRDAEGWARECRRAMESATARAEAEARRADAAESLLRSEREGGGGMAPRLSSSSSPTATGDVMPRAEEVREKEEGKEDNIEEGEEGHYEEGGAREDKERQGRQREQAATSAAISTTLLWLQSSMEANQRQIEEITEYLASG